MIMHIKVNSLIKVLTWFCVTSIFSYPSLHGCFILRLVSRRIYGLEQGYSIRIQIGPVREEFLKQSYRTS